ncbi:MAG: ribulose bisphosphate carboxylase small subunit [Synechococcus lacustris]|jgi:ribulose-bisphosphate carboxylase small chain
MSAINTGDYKTVATLETFSFLPAFTTEQLHQQIAYIIKSGWSPSIEHVHPSKSMNIYWDQWKIPFFGEKDLNVVLSELEAAHKAYPDHHIKLIGYDSKLQNQGSSFVVFKAAA